MFCDSSVVAMIDRYGVSLTMVNGVGFESIQLKEAVLDGHIAHKVKGLHGPHSTDSILLLWQVPWLRSP